MEMLWPGQQVNKEVKGTKFSCFNNIYYPQSSFISEVIKNVDWGSNRVIRQQGFRILPITTDLIPLKQWSIIKDPYYLIKESSYISQPKGQSIIVVHIGCIP